jgi:hypothetical protein
MRKSNPERRIHGLAGMTHSRRVQAGFMSGDWEARSARGELTFVNAEGSTVADSSR